MKGAWNESSKGFAPGANMAPVRSSASRRYAPAHAPCRAGMEVRLRMVHARHRYPGCKRHPVPVWRSASRGYGGLPPEGMESCLQTMRMRHRSPAWRESSRRSAPAARVLLVLLGINNIRKQRGYRCRFVVSSVGASTCNYRGVMRFFRGAHDPKRGTSPRFDLVTMAGQQLAPVPCWHKPWNTPHPSQTPPRCEA